MLNSDELQKIKTLNGLRRQLKVISWTHTQDGYFCSYELGDKYLVFSATPQQMAEELLRDNKIEAITPGTPLLIKYSFLDSKREKCFAMSTLLAYMQYHCQWDWINLLVMHEYRKLTEVEKIEIPAEPGRSGVDKNGQLFLLTLLLFCFLTSCTFRSKSRVIEKFIAPAHELTEYKDEKVGRVKVRKPVTVKVPAAYVLKMHTTRRGDTLTEYYFLSYDEYKRINIGDSLTSGK